MKAYSEDLRKKIVRALLRGTGKSEAARLFGVSLSSVKRYARTAREGRTLTPKKNPGKRPKLGKSARALLEADVEERPAALRSPNNEGSSRKLQTVTRRRRVPLPPVFGRHVGRSRPRY